MSGRPAAVGTLASACTLLLLAGCPEPARKTAHNAKSARPAKTAQTDKPATRKPAEAKSTDAPASAPARQVDPLQQLGLMMEERPSKPPEAVREDARYVARTFRELPHLTSPPAWLTARRLWPQLRRRLSGYDEEELESQLSAAKKGEADRLRWGPLDPARKLHLLSYHFGPEAGGLALVDDTGRVLQTRETGAGNQAYLKDVAGDATPEIIVPVVVGPWVSLYPAIWELYTVTAGRRLKKIATVPKYYSWGSKWQRYCFLNQVLFPSKGVMQVRTVHLDRTRCAEEARNAVKIPQRLDERHDYRFRGGRFIEVR